MGFMKNYLVWLEENGHVYWNDLFETYDWNTDPMTNPDLLNKYMASLDPDPEEIDLDATGDYGVLVDDDDLDEVPYDPDFDGDLYVDLFDEDGITADAQAMLHDEDTNGDFV